MIFTTTSMICICKRRDVYDGIHCVADLSSDGTLLRSYTWGVGIDNLLAVTLYGGDSTNTLYAVTDPLGTVHALVGTNGVPAVTYAYDSWGNLLSVSGDESPAASLRFTWQGREYSHATGLYSFRARWYDPASGRWLSKDPIGLEGGLNLYEAFGNNPVCFRDPEGDNPIIIVIGVAIIFSKVACYSAKKIESAKKVDTDDFYEVGNYLVDESCEFLNEVSPNPWLGTSPLKDGDLIEDAVKAPIWRPYWEENYRRPLKESIRRTKHQRR